ncbi:MAG: hypothetical protein II110_02445, partial [Treponema sp.]|nr:hypothetical protein [Treponema sp.]
MFSSESGTTNPEALSRTSWARTTDGGDNWGWTADATPGASNATSVFTNKRLAAPIVNEGSQIIKGTLNVKVDFPKDAILMYTTDGSMPLIGSGSARQSQNGVFTVTKT